jgi:hypothetical protein
MPQFRWLLIASLFFAAGVSDADRTDANRTNYRWCGVVRRFGIQLASPVQGSLPIMSTPQESPGAVGVHLKRLHRDCEITLTRYHDIASDTCKLLGRLRTLPVSKDKRLEVFLQQRREDDAMEAYQRARESLLTAIRNDPDFIVETSREDPARVPPRRAPRVGAHRRRSG